MGIVEEMVDANPSALIDLYELDITNLPNFNAFEFEAFYDTIPSENLYVETNWSVVSDVFYIPKFEDLSDWTLLVDSGKSWNTINTDVTGYVGVLDAYPPVALGSYFIEKSSGISYLMTETTSGSFFHLHNFEFSDYGDFNQNTGTYTLYTDKIELTGNKWVAVDYTYTITPDTVMELKYNSSVQGSVHGIGLNATTITGLAVSYIAPYYALWYQDISDNDPHLAKPMAMTFSQSGRYLLIARKDTGKIYGHYSGIPYSLYNMYFYPGGNELDVSSEDYFMSGISLVDSDTILYAAGGSTNKIYKYILTVAGDIKTATYSGQSYEIPTAIASSTFWLQGLHVKEDGTGFYITMNSDDIYENVMYQFSMGTAYDLTSSTYYGKSSTLEVVKPQDIYVTADGTRAYMVDYRNPKIYQYDMKTAGDITTAESSGFWDTNLNYEEEAKYYENSTLEYAISTFTFSQDGKYLFLAGNDTDAVHKYGLINAFNVDREQEVSESSSVIQLSGYDTFGINYKVFDDSNTEYVHLLIPIGEIYASGSVYYMFFGVSTSGITSEDANAIFYDIDVYEKGFTHFEEITRTTKVTFPQSCLLTTMLDKVIIFDTTVDDRQMWKTILNTELNAGIPPELKFSDMSSGLLYIGTDAGIYAYDFILDTNILDIVSTTILDLKTTMTLEGSINTDRINQPIPVLVYIDDGSLKVRKHIDGVYITYVPISGTPTNFIKIEISASKELYVFTNTNKVYYFGNIENISNDFTFKDSYNYFSGWQQDVMFNGTINTEYTHVLLSTKDGLYAKISSYYNTGYYSDETYSLSAAFEDNEDIVFDGIQVVQNPNFLQGSKYYIYDYGWEYSNHTMIAKNAYSGFYQNILLPSIEDYIVTVHVSDIQSGSLSVIMEPVVSNGTEEDVLIQYILDGSSDYINATETRYIRPIQETVFEERDIAGEGIFSFKIPTRSYKVSLIVLGNNFTGTVNSVKMSKLSSNKAVNRVSSNQDIEVYGPLEYTTTTDESNMVQYTNGVFCQKLASIENYIYYWEFDGISWKFIYHEGYSSNEYDGIYYIDCTMPKALIRISGVKYTDNQLAVIRVNELKLFSSDSNVLLERCDEIDNEYPGVNSVSFDDRTGYYYTQMEQASKLQKFRDLVCVGTVEVNNNSYFLNAHNNSITINNYGTYDIKYYGDSTASSHGDAGIYRFYNGTNQYGNPIVWKEKAYQPWPIKVDGYELSGDREIPRPTLTAGNIGFLLSDLVYTYDDLLGAKVTRKRTFARYLDSVNFTSGNIYADSTIEFPDTVFYINKKVSETYEVISFELASQWDLEGIKLPRRLVTYDTCRWQYKDGSCGYSGTDYFDIHGDSVDYVTQDVCGKHLDDCLKRFTDIVLDGDDVPSSKITSIPFGGFPGVGL